MKIRIRCSSCGNVATANQQLFGKTVPCPSCKAPIKVPVPKQSTQPAQQQPLSPTTLESVRYQKHAHGKGKKSTKPSSDLNLILLIVGIAVGALVIGGGIVWAVLSSQKARVANNTPVAGDSANFGTTTGENGDKSASSADPTATSVADTSGISRAPWLTFKYAPQKSYVYEIEFVSKDSTGEKQTSSCSMILEASPQQSVDAKPNKKLNANSYGTGLGLPGNRVLIPSETIEKSTSLEIQIGDKTYPAWRGTDLGNPELALLEYDGPALPPVRINPFHDYEPAPFVLQRDPMAKLFFRGRVKTKTNVKERPLDEIRKQEIDGGSRANAATLLGSKTGIAFDRTGTLYGIVSEEGDILPTALLQSLISEKEKPKEELFDATPFEDRKRLTEKELADFVSKNIVSVHAINPPSVDKRVFGTVKIIDSQPINCGPYNFDADSFEQLNWTFVGQKEFRKGGGSFPFFLGRCSDLLFFSLAGQRTEDWSTEQLVQSNGKSRFDVKSEKWNTSSKNIPGSLKEELKITDHDSNIAKITRKIMIRFPDLEKFTVPEMWKPGEKDTCIVEAAQLIKFDHILGVILESTTTGTIEHALDSDEEKEEFEIRMRMVEWKSKSPPKELKPLTQENVDSIVEWLTAATLTSKRQAIDALLQIQPEKHDSISTALARHKPLERGWNTPFHQLAQRWILPEHTDIYLGTEGPDARSSVLPEMLRILELRPPTEIAKPWIRKALLTPERQEYLLAGRVVRNTYPDMAGEVADALKAITEYKECHGEWIRCIKCVGKANCAPALESYIASLQSMGPRYDSAFERYIKYAQQALEQVKLRPAPESKSSDSDSVGSSPEKSS